MKFILPIFIGEKMHVFIAVEEDGYFVYPACSLFA